MGRLYGEGTADEKLLRLADLLSSLYRDSRIINIAEQQDAIVDISNLRGMIEDIKKIVQG